MDFHQESIVLADFHQERKVRNKSESWLDRVRLRETTAPQALQVGPSPGALLGRNVRFTYTKPQLFRWYFLNGGREISESKGSQVPCPRTRFHIDKNRRHLHLGSSRICRICRNRPQAWQVGSSGSTGSPPKRCQELLLGLPFHTRRGPG